MKGLGTTAALAAMAALLTLPTAATADQHSKPSTLEGSSIAWCGDVQDITADPAFYRDRPVYLGNPPTQKIRKWARQQPGFQELWIDRDNLGWITVGFTEGVAERQADLEELFPDIGVVAAELPHTARELRQLQRRLGDAVFGEYVTSGGVSRGVPQGMVGLEANVVTDELVAFLETEFAGQPFCLDGPDPADIVQPGPQPDAGDGWTLLAAHQAGPPWFQTGVAAGPGKLDALWAKAKVPGPVPEVDFEQDIVLWFAVPHGSSCDQLRLDGVVVDEEKGRVYPAVVHPDNPMICTADLAGAYQFLVAFERTRLPEPPFIVQLDEWGEPAPGSKELTVVEADLRAAGAGPGPDGIHRNVPEPTPAVGPDGLRRTRLQPSESCGISYFGNRKSIDWVSEVREPPEAWVADMEPDGSFVVGFEMQGGDDPYLDATLNGQTVRYLPWRGDPPDCVAET